MHQPQSQDQPQDQDPELHLEEHAAMPPLPLPDADRVSAPLSSSSSASSTVSSTNNGGPSGQDSHRLGGDLAQSNHGNDDVVAAAVHGDAPSVLPTLPDSSYYPGLNFSLLARSPAASYENGVGQASAQNHVGLQASVYLPDHKILTSIGQHPVVRH